MSASESVATWVARINAARTLEQLLALNAQAADADTGLTEEEGMAVHRAFTRRMRKLLAAVPPADPSGEQ